MELKKIKELITVGSGDLIGTSLSAGFWFYLASLMTAENYGQISYFIAIGGIASTISLIGSTNTLTVHTAKNLKTESTLYITSLIITAISAIVVAIIFYNPEIMAYIFGAVIFGLSSSEILGKNIKKGKKITRRID